MPIKKKLEHFQIETYQKLCQIRHPYIETILSVTEEGETAYSINEFINRPDSLNYEMYDALYNPSHSQALTLQDFIVPDHFCSLGYEFDGIHFLPEKQALLLIYQLCIGLEELKKNGLIHGDISPQNLLLASPPAGEPLDPLLKDCPFILKIIDFGTTKAPKPSHHAVTSVMGTKPFAAPELLAYNKPTDRIDIYSLGCILHYMCLGVSPAENGFSDAKIHLSKGVCRIIQRCNADYDTRYRSLRSLKTAIKKELQKNATPFSKAFSHIPGFRTRKLWKMLLASYVYFAIFLSCGTDLYYRNFNYNLWFSMAIILIEIIFMTDAFGLGEKFPRYQYFMKRRPVLFWFTKGILALLLFILLCLLY